MLSELYERLNVESERHLISFYDGEAKETGRIYGRDLLQRADAISAGLVHQYGLVPGDRVLLSYPPSLEFVYALAGCLFGGLIPVPVYPPVQGRFDHDLALFTRLAQDCGASLVLTTQAYKGARKFDLEALSSVSVGSNVSHIPWVNSEDFREASGSLPRYVPAQDEVALLQYTSGSTSVPKGVRVTWQNLAFQRAFYKDAIRLSADSRLVYWIPQYHDMGLIGGILNCFFLGCWLGLLAPLSFLKRPAAWFDVLDEVKGSHVAAPDFSYALSVSKTTEVERSQWDLSSLEVLINGAEQVRPETTRSFLEAFAVSGLKPETWCPSYGLAEYTLAVTLFGGRVHSFARRKLEQDGVALLAQGGEDAVELVSCGKIRDDLTIRFVEPATLTPLGDGHVGEIWLDSPSKTDGYWEREELTQEVFHATLSGGSQGFLRTGDLGFSFGGELYICGRLKDLLVVGGRNIHPEDIEATVQKCHPQVRLGGVAAFSIAEGPDESDALGLLVEVKNKGFTEAQAQEVLAAIQREVAVIHRLSCAMVALVPPGSALKTTSGKLRRRACRDAVMRGRVPLLLLKREEASPNASDTAGEAQSAEQLRGLSHEARWEFLQGLVCRVISDVLSLPAEKLRAGSFTFREIGLDSLLAIEARNRLEQRLRLGVDTTLFLQSNTLDSAVTAINQHLLNKEAPSSVANILSESCANTALWEQVVGERALLSRVALAAPEHADQWAMGKYIQESAMHNVGALLRVPLRLDPVLLEQALGLLSMRHDALRCRFFERDGDVWMKVVPGVDHQVTVFDLSMLSAPAQRDRIASLAKELPMVPFSLAQTPMLRLSVVLISAQESLLSLCASLSIFDGWSLALFFEELSAAYSALLQAQVPSWKPAPSYYSACEAQTRWLASEEADAARAWWGSYLEGVVVHPLPTDFDAPAMRSDKGGLVTLQLSASFSAQLDKAAQAFGCTPFVLLFGAWALLLHHVGKQDRFAVAVAVARRLEESHARMLGLLEEDLPLCCELRPSLSLREALEHIRGSVLSLLEHQKLPLYEIEQVMDEPPGGSFSSFLRTLFVLHPLEWATMKFAGESVESLYAPAVEGTAEYDLSLFLRTTPDGYEASLFFASDFFLESTATQLLQYYQCILEGIEHQLRGALEPTSLASFYQRVCT